MLPSPTRSFSLARQLILRSTLAYRCGLSVAMCHPLGVDFAVTSDAWNVTLSATCVICSLHFRRASMLQRKSLMLWRICGLLECEHPC